MRDMIVNFDSAMVVELSGDDVSTEIGFGVAGGGTHDHRKLTHLDAADQHPISAITGLANALEEAECTPLTNIEILNIINGGI